MINNALIETNSENEPIPNNLSYNSFSDNDNNSFYDYPKINEFISLKNTIIYSNSENTGTYNLNFIFSNNYNIFEAEENSVKIIIDNNNIDNNNNSINEKIANDDNKILGKKPGREKKSKNNRIHDKYSKDNITRKIQIHYLKFLINFVNFLIKEILFEKDNSKNIEFYPLNHNFLKEINKKAVDSLKKKCIGEILKDNISPRYKSNNNIDVYNLVTCKSNIIKKILEQKYLDFFNDYYYNNKKINLSEFGLDKELILSNDIELYEDLKIKNRTNSLSDEKYINKMEKIIRKDFRPTIVASNNFPKIKNLLNNK